MRNMFRIAFALIMVGFMAASTPVSAQEEGPELSFEFGLDNASKYVWRGIIVNDEQVMQPSVTAAFGGLSFNIWANYDMTDSGGRGSSNISEVDYTLAYEGSMDMINYALGVIYYDFPGQSAASTTEIFGSIGLDVVLSPTLTVYYDIDEVEGFYGNFSIGHSIPLNDAESFSLDLGAAVGWGDSDYNSAYFGASSGFVDAVGSAGLGYVINDNVSVGISLSYVKLLDSKVEDNAKSLYGDADALWTTFSVSVGF